MTNALLLPGLQASWPPLPSRLALSGECCNGSPKWMQTWVEVRGPAIPMRKEILNPNQQPGKRGSEDVHIWHPPDGVNRSKYT